MCGSWRGSTGIADAVFGEVGFPRRQRDRKGSAAIQFAFDGDRTAMQPNQFVHEGQADARAFVGPSARAFDSMKAFEEPREFAGRNADARVPNREHHVPVAPIESNSDGARERELEGVGQ